MADDIKDTDEFKSLQRKFTRLSQKIKNKDEDIKKKAYRVAKKIVIGALDDVYENEENGEFNWDSDFFGEGEREERESFFDARDAAVEAVSIKDAGYNKEEIKKVLLEMINNNDPNQVGGKRKQKRKTKGRRKVKKSKKTRRT
jgi:hypothetical protein